MSGLIAQFWTIWATIHMNSDKFAVTSPVKGRFGLTHCARTITLPVMTSYFSLRAIKLAALTVVVIVALAFTGFASARTLIGAIDHLPAHDMSLSGDDSPQDCVEHGPKHATSQGNHCCASTAMGTATLPSAGISHSAVGACLAWAAEERLSLDPVFGIFRPPRVV